MFFPGDDGERRGWGYLGREFGESKQGERCRGSSVESVKNWTHLTFRGMPVRLEQLSKIVGGTITGFWNLRALNGDSCVDM